MSERERKLKEVVEELKINEEGSIDISINKVPLIVENNDKIITKISEIDNFFNSAKAVHKDHHQDIRGSFDELISKAYLTYPQYFIQRGILRLEHFQQATKHGCSETSVLMILKFYNIELSNSEISELYSLESIENMEHFLNRYIKSELKEKATYEDLEHILSRADTAILRVVPFFQKERHSVVFLGLDKDNIYLNDPAFRNPLKVDKEVFSTWWSKTNYLIMEFRR
jgi:hypothetical protein